MGRPPAGVTFRDRLLSGIIIDLDSPLAYDGSPCWPWTRRKRGGYGLIKQGTRNVQTHVAVFEMFRGPLPEGTEPDHKCHDPGFCNLGDCCPHRACCNPWHMEPETHRVNVLLGGGPTAINATKKNCPKCGKDYELRADGNRQCLECATWGRIKTAKTVDKQLTKAQETNEHKLQKES